MTFLEALCLISGLILIYSLVCIAEDTLAPPLNMASKEFHRELRSEARKPEDVIMRASIFSKWLWKVDLKGYTQTKDRITLLAIHQNTQTHIMALCQIDPADISEATYRKLERLRLSLVARADMVVARYLEITDLNGRAEARMKSNA